MKRKVALLFRTLGPGGFARVAARALNVRLISKTNRFLYSFGQASVVDALKIIAHQSPDAPTQAAFRFFLNQVVNSRDPFVAVVPNYLGPACRHLRSFVHPKSRFLTYRDASPQTVFDWAIVQNNILGLVAPALEPQLAQSRIVYSDQGFHILHRTSNLPEVLDAASRVKLTAHVRDLAHGGEVGTVEKHGFKYGVRLKTTDLSIINEVHVEYLQWLWPEVRNLNAVVDIGAQIGGFTTQISRHLAPGGKVHAIEPEPENFKLLTQNIHLNGLDGRVVAEAAALSDQDGQATLSVSSDNTGGNKLGVPEASSNLSVQVRTIDALRFLKGLGPVDLIKIDVEGWEYPILNRMRPALKNVRFIMGELQRSDVGGPQQVLELLRSESFEVETKGTAELMLFRARRTG